MLIPKIHIPDMLTNFSKAFPDLAGLNKYAELI